MKQYLKDSIEFLFDITVCLVIAHFLKLDSTLIIASYALLTAIRAKNDKCWFCKNKIPIHRGNTDDMLSGCIFDEGISKPTGIITVPKEDK